MRARCVVLLAFGGLGAWGCGADPEPCLLQQGLNVKADLVHDNRTATVADSVVVLLTDGVETPTACPATVALIDGSTRLELEQTAPGRHAGGTGEGLPEGLPAVTLVPGKAYGIEVDIDSDGTVEAMGAVTMPDVQDFQAVDPAAGSVTFTWSDGAASTGTTYYVQASDQADFLFPEKFATGLTQDKSISFSGTSYFAVDPGVPCYARIQAQAPGTVSVPGRIEAWEHPPEPIVTYSY